MSAQGGELAARGSIPHPHGQIVATGGQVPAVRRECHGPDQPARYREVLACQAPGDVPRDDGALYAALSHTREAAYVLRIQPDGTVDLEGEVSCPGWRHLRTLPDGNLLFAGIPVDETAIHLCVVSPDLQPVRSTTYQPLGPTWNGLNRLAIGVTGHVALAGTSTDDTIPDTPAYAFLALLEPDLTLRWEWTHSLEQNSEHGSDVEIAPNGDVYLLRRFSAPRLHVTVRRWEVVRFRP